MTGAYTLAEAHRLLRERCLHKALREFDRGERLDAAADQCSAGRWLCNMLLGNFGDAWRESDAIRARNPDDPHRFWQGENVRGRRLMLRCLHGFGDAVQFLRFVPRLLAVAEDLTIEVPPRLAELAPFLAHGARIITWGENAPAVCPEWDLQIEINELCYLLRLDSSDLPGSECYLSLPAEVLQPYRVEASDPGTLRMGAVWAGGEWNPARSIPFSIFEKLLEVSGVECWNLQGGPARDDWSSYGEGRHAAAPCRDSILGLAATIAQMDLVITTDTLAAHLAGAQGVPCWLLLQHAADWRWMDGRDSSPWYPSLRLFRCGPGDDWKELVEHVREELAEAGRQRDAR